MNSAWDSADSALLVIDFSSLDDLKHYRDALRDSGLNVNNCVLLAIVPTKKERLVLSNNTLAVFISEKDFNLFGKLKYQEAMNQLKRKFDLCIQIDDKSKSVQKLLGKMSFRMRIGVNCTKNDQDVNLSTVESTPKHLINFAKNTLGKIN